MHLRTVIGATLSWVRIPLPPPVVGVKEGPQISVCGPSFTEITERRSNGLGYVDMFGTLSSYGWQSHSSSGSGFGSSENITNINPTPSVLI